MKVAEKVEKDLFRDGLHSAYNEQSLSQLDRGVAVKLSDEELESWTGPCQYITHHAVLKDSVTTPVRVVSNSSFNNGGNSLNSCLACGPNSLNPMLDVLLVAAQRIKDDVFVDDGLTGGDEEQVSRFVGVKQEDGNYDIVFWKFQDQGLCQVW